MLASGPAPLVLVACGGLSVGFFLWYWVVSHGAGTALSSETVLVTGLVVGVAGTFASWYAYSRYFARRAGIPIVAALRWDAISWAMLSVYLVSTVLPIAFGSPTRIAFIAFSLWALVKVLVAARFLHTVRDVLTTYVVTRISIIVIAELASVTIGQRPGQHFAASQNPLLAVWGRWDAVHYLDIARRGYYGTDMAFFPLYPLLTRIAGGAIGNYLVGGLLISNVALFFGLLFFYKLVEHQFNRAIAHRAIFYISIFPTAIFFSAVYTEALFFALTVASFYYIREHKWIAAGLLGALAALTRVEGILLAVPFAIEAVAPNGFANWRMPSFTLERIVRILIGIALIPAGLVAYMTVLWVLRGDPLYFSHVQIHWNRHLAPPWVSVWHSVHLMFVTHTPLTVSGQLIELAFTALMIATLVAGFSRLRPSFAAYMLLSILVPMCTSSLMSMPRFALVLFPMFVLFAIWGNRAWINNAIVAFSLPLLGLFTVLFADWYWVA